jgi:hypothetical protein
MPLIDEDELTWLPRARHGHDDDVQRLTRLIRDELARLDEWCPPRGLPAWLAPIAAGDALFSDGGDVPDEWVDLLGMAEALGPHRTVLPPVRPLSLELSGQPLAARRAGTFSIDLLLIEPARVRSGPTWSDESGRTWLATAPQLRALHLVSLGPPDCPPGADAPTWTDARYLWWTRRQEECRRAGIKLDGVLAAADIEVWDQLRPKLVAGTDGRPSLRVAPSERGRGLDSDEGVHKVLQQLAHRPDLHPSIRHNRRRVRVVVTDKGRAALKSLFEVDRQLRESPETAALLRDAPETLLDPELFDLDGYSDRVVGIELVPPVYRPRPTGREHWSFSGGGQSGPDLSQAQWAAVWAALGRAAAEGRSYAFVHGHWFRVPPPDTLPPDPTQAVPRAELQVHQNIDELNYSSADTGAGVITELPPRPPGLADGFELYAHQDHGVRWLAGHAAWDAASSDHGMLADDMGLGKTVQVLSLMSHLLERDELGPMLLVAPLSLLDNWRNEAETFFPRRFGRPLVLGGPEGARGLQAGLIQQSRWTLASYESVRRNQLELGKVRFELIVLDESHRIKNPTAGVTRAMLAMHAKRRIALTGTPVQNRLSELWSQFDWLSPGWLGDLSTFDQTYAEQGDLAALERLRNQVGSRILRRMKHRVLASELPPLHADSARHRPRLRMAPDQRDLYDAVVRDKSNEGKRGSFGLLHRLFQVCACPGMVADRPVGDPKRAWLWTLLDELRKRGEKVLIFAEWYELQDSIVREIAERYAVFADRVNGQVKPGERLERVNRFNAADGFAVFVLGPRAAGVGLNITGANHVVHYTRHWNPALEAQATDRAYRIGQTRPVHVYRPIVEHPEVDSMEVYLDRLLREKEELAEQVIVPTAQLNVGKDLVKVVGRAD